MARVKMGILDGFSGTVGTVVGGNWRGIEYMRAKTKKKRRGGTEKQLAQQARFALGVKFVKALQSLFETSYSGYAREMTGPNSALSHILKNAVTGEGPTLKLEYSEIRISRGSLPGARDASATSQQDSISFAWVNNTGQGKAKETDKVLLVAYCEEENDAVFSLGSAIRSAGVAALAMPDVFRNKRVHVWISFLSADEKETADSRYVDAVQLV